MVERSHDHWLCWRLSACSPVRLQQQLSVLQEVLQFCLLSVNQSEPSVELRPRPPCSDQTSELEPLRLWVTWSHGDRFQLQVPTSADAGGRVLLPHGLCPPRAGE